MRHFSGEFEGMRLLMLDELELIAGGDGEDTDDVQNPPPEPDGPDIVVNGRRITVDPLPYYPAGSPSPSYDLPPDPSPAKGTFHPSGGCGTQNRELDEALSNLENGSAAAKALLDAARELDTKINLIRENASTGNVDRENNGEIWWDPFSAVTGTNFNGTTYHESPTMSLMHEIAHAVLPRGTSEYEVMNVVNAIARQMNVNTGTNYDTSRTSHSAVGSRTYDVNDTDSTNESTRPACAA